MKKLRSDEEKLTRLQDRYSHADGVLSPYFDELKKYERLYWGVVEVSDGSWKSRVFDNISMEAVERYVSHLFATTPRGRFLPREPRDELGALVMDQIYRYQWNSPNQNMGLKMRSLGLQGGIFGAGFGVLDWRHEEENQRRREVDRESGEIVETEQLVERYDCPFFKDLYLYDVRFEPEAVTIDDMEYWFYDEYMTLSQLKMANRGGEKRYKNLGKLERLVKEGKKDDGVGSGSANQGDLRTNVAEITKMDSGGSFNRIKVRHYRTRKKWQSYAVDYNVLVEDIDNPYWHGDLNLHMFADYTYSNRLLGRGEIEPIKTQQRAINSVLNQRLDNVRLILNTPFKGQAGSRHMAEWKIAPGWINLVDDPDELTQMTIHDVTGDTFIQTENYFKDSVSRQLGHIDFLSRNETTGDKTATEIRTAAGEQNARIKDKEKSVDAFTERLSNQWAVLNQQFLSADKMVRIAGEDAVKLIKEKLADENGEIDESRFQEIANNGYLLISPDDIKGNYDFVVETGSMSSVDSEGKIAGYTMAIDTLNRSKEGLMEQNTKVNLKPILEKQLRELGVKEVDEVLSEMTEEELMKLQQQKMMEQNPNLSRSIIPQ